MVEWNPGSVKPAISKIDEWDKETQSSDKVIVRVIDSYGRFAGYTTAKYRHRTNTWIIDGYLGNYTVTHWSSLNEPEI